MAKKKQYKRIEDMTKEEWRARIDEVAKNMGWDDTIKTQKKPDPRFTERREGTTPLGGDYSIAYFYDADHKPCEKAKAKFVNIVIYDKDGRRINEVYGNLGL
ncbi:MAG: hypothetical protein J5529_03085 [Prevotella sp.]|nr:hypothetical protein [Prevotella sp.]